MPTTTRRLLSVLFASTLLLPLSATVASAADAPEIVTQEVLTQSASDLVLLTNRQRAGLGLVLVRPDADLMAIARDRAEVMAANDVMSHTEPSGQKVFSRLTAAGLTWFAAGEIIAWNNYPTEPLSVAESIRAWMASPAHHDIMVSTGYNYVGYGAAVSASGKRYYAGVFAKEPDKTAPWAHFRSLARHSSAGRIRVTLRWTGGDRRLQVLTSGLRYYQASWRTVGGPWHPWGTSTKARRSATWRRGTDKEVRIRARDRAGNWSPWQIIRVNL
jgi:uncharacterized protein YkwD